MAAAGQGALELLDRALDLARRELGHLAADEVDAVPPLVKQREQLLHEAFAAGDGSTEPGELLGKLRQLRSMQRQLTGEAQRLHERLRQDLTRVRSENRRITGYAGVRRGVPTVRYRLFDKTS